MISITSLLDERKLRKENRMSLSDEEKEILDEIGQELLEKINEKQKQKTR